MMDIGKRIRKLRIEKDWTLEDMKNKTGLSISFLSDIERGVSNPSLNKLKILASSLDVSMGFLLGENNIYKYNIPFIYSKNNMKQLKTADQKNNKYYLLDIIDLKNYVFEEIKKINNKSSNTHFLVISNDNSMKGSGIPAGSHLLIRKQKSVKNGKVAFLYLKDSKKIFIRKIYKNNNNLIIQADNSQYETLIKPEDSIEIIGKVISSTYYFER